MCFQERNSRKEAQKTQRGEWPVMRDAPAERVWSPGFSPRNAANHSRSQNWHALPAEAGTPNLISSSLWQEGFRSLLLLQPEKLIGRRRHICSRVTAVDDNG